MPDVGAVHCRTCCEIATDNFNRADSDSLGANWTEDVGDADIASNELSWAATGIIHHTTPHPNGDRGAMRVKVRFKRSSTSQYACVLAAFQDSAHLVLAMVSTDVDGCDHLAVSSIGAGGATIAGNIGLGGHIVGDGCPVDEWHTLELCWTPGGYYYGGGFVARAKLTLASGKVYGWEQRDPRPDLPCEVWMCDNSGAYSGLAAAAGVLMDDFHFGHMKTGASCKAICPNCNTPCLIESDDFNRADADDPGCKWQEQSPSDWDIVSSELKLISVTSPPNFIRCTVGHPQLKLHHHVTCDVFLDSGLKPRVCVCMVSNNNDCLWAKLEISGASGNNLTLTIGTRVGSTDTTLATETGTITPGQFYEVTVCYDGFILTANVNEITAFAATSFSGIGSIYAGLGGHTGGERFDNFVFEKHYSPIDEPLDLSCPNCDNIIDGCGACLGGNAPQSFLVRFQGVTNNLASCPHNITVLLQSVPIVLLPACNGVIPAANPDDCMWGGVMPDGALVCLYLQSSPKRLWVTVFKSVLVTCSGTYVFRNAGGSEDFDCLNLEDYEVTNLTTIVAGCCNYLLARCFVTSMP